jgi:hypothetical protein
MSKHNECLRVPIIVLLTGLFSGCAIPTAVKSLSQEQVQVQEQYLETQKSYFSLIEKYVESQIKTTELLIASSTQELTQKYKQRALKALKPGDATNNKEVLDDLVQLVTSEYKSDQEGINRLYRLLYDLKQKHQEMLSAYATMVSAQKKLNEYIQLERADEVFINEMLAVIGVERGKISGLFDSAAGIYTEIEKLTKGGK